MSEMTDDQVNRVLAEKVMGWPVIDDDEPFSRHADKGGVVTSCGPGVIRHGVIPQAWSPPTNRNDLAEVLAKLTPEQWSRLDQSFTTIYYLRSDASSRHSFTRWLLTCDPAIIARAVAEVVSKEHP